MVLDERLQKLATDISVSKAVRAFIKSRAERLELSDLERAQADEFSATLEAMFLMAAVDGSVSEPEIARVRSSFEDLVVAEGDATRLDFESLLDGFRRSLESDGWQARLGSVASRIPTTDGRALAFRLAAAVAFVDDQVESAEAAGIEALAAAFGLNADQSQELLRKAFDELFGAG
jgi:hypothetical protein